jgi:hypothetical protein
MKQLERLRNRPSPLRGHFVYIMLLKLCHCCPVLESLTEERVICPEVVMYTRVYKVFQKTISEVTRTSVNYSWCSHRGRDMTLLVPVYDCVCC